MPLIEKAKNHSIELFFMDASHFVMGAFAGRVWSAVRMFVRTPSGHSRFNVLGALNFISKKVETVTNSTYITSVQVIELMEKLSKTYIKPIYVVLDNAAYQRCNLVKEKAATLGINLVYLPTYSPNLNLIERVWKLVKSRVLSLAYYETFLNFSQSIETCVNTLHENLTTEMESIITSNFNIIRDNNIINSTTNLRR
jgi:transposase